MSNYCSECGRKLKVDEICNCKSVSGESFYVKDFIKNFFRVRNIPIMVYLVVNMLFIYFVSLLFIPSILEMLNITMSYKVQQSFPFVLGLVIGVIYFVCISLSLSDIGEALLRQKNGCNPITDKEIAARMEPIFHEVYEKARTLEPSIADDVVLFIQDEEKDEESEPNAFAVGRKSICITKGLLDCSDEEIKAILGHEFGHLAHKDTDLSLVINIANWLINMAFFEIILLLLIIKIIMKLLSLVCSIAGETPGVIMSKVADLIFSVLMFIGVRMFQKAWLALGNLLLLVTSRQDEFVADEFSAKLGYGNGLTTFFKTLPDSAENSSLPFFKTVQAFASIGSTHPATWKRINKLNNIIGDNILVLSNTDNANELTIVSVQE